jgi:hypothetical protein
MWSHESFIRNWSKFQTSETGDRKGWLDREAEDRLQWSSLSLQAKSRFGILFPTASVGAWRWLAQNNANWAKRYGGDFDALKELIQRSAAVGFAMVFFVLIASIGLLGLTAYSYVQKRAAAEKERAATMNETIALASLSRVALQEGLPVESVKLALAAWLHDDKAERPKLRRTLDMLSEVLPRVSESLRLEGHTDWVTAVAFSPDGRRILTGSPDQTALLWDAASGAPLKTLQGHAGSVYAVAFSPDGTRILTGSGDNTARLWDAASGAQLKTLEGHTGPVSAVAFSPDGTHILTGSWDNTALLWDIADLEKGNAFEVACQKLGKLTWDPKMRWDLKDVGQRYGLDPLPPICGDHPPAPVDLRELQ